MSARRSPCLTLCGSPRPHNVPMVQLGSRCGGQGHTWPCHATHRALISAFWPLPTNQATELEGHQLSAQIPDRTHRFLGGKRGRARSLGHCGEGTSARPLPGQHHSTDRDTDTARALPDERSSARTNSPFYNPPAPPPSQGLPVPSHIHPNGPAQPHLLQEALLSPEARMRTHHSPALNLGTNGSSSPSPGTPRGSHPGTRLPQACLLQASCPETHC